MINYAGYIIRMVHIVAPALKHHEMHLIWLTPLFPFCRCCATVPEAASLSSPECVWTGCLGLGQHHRWVTVGMIMISFRIKNSQFQDVHLIYVCSLQAMGLSAGTMWSAWAWWSLFSPSSVPPFPSPSFAMSPGSWSICAATRTLHHPWRRSRRCVWETECLYSSLIY